MSALGPVLSRNGEGALAAERRPEPNRQRPVTSVPQADAYLAATGV